MSQPRQFQPFWAVIFIVALTAAAYLNTLHNPLVWDDAVLVEQNSFIRNARYIPAAFTIDLFHGDSDLSATHYRPLQTLTYMADYFFWGTNPAGYHLTNLLLHLGCALLLFALLQAWWGRLPLSFAVAAIFAVHPINTNAITYVAGRADPLALLGMLASLWLLHHSGTGQRSPRQWLGFIGAQLAFLLALFSRENAVLLPAIVFLYGTFVGEPPRRDWRRGLKLALPFVVLAVGYMLLRHEMLAWPGRQADAVWALPWETRVTVMFRALATYVGLFLWPANLQMQREVIFSSAWLTWAGVGAALALTAALVWAWRKSMVTLVGGFWFLALLAPLLGIIPLNATVAEHWAYVPSIGFYLLVASLAMRLPYRRALALTLAMAVTALTARTAARNHEWSDPATFFTRAVAKVPQNDTLRGNLSRELASQGETNAALAHLLAAEQAAPAYPQGKTRLAWFYFKQNQLPAARAKVEESLRLNPDSTTALLLAAYISESEQDWRGAEKHYLRALGTTINVRGWVQYGDFLFQQRRFNEARSVANAALRLEPGNANAWNLRGIVLAEMEDWTGAEQSFAEAARCDRHTPAAWINRGRLALRRNLPAEAVPHFRKAAQISSADAPIRYHLAHALWQSGQVAGAEAELTEALAHAPGSERIQQVLTALRRGDAQPFSAP